jgi:hypothetical protein
MSRQGNAGKMKGYPAFLTIIFITPVFPISGIGKISSKVKTFRKQDKE